MELIYLDNASTTKPDQGVIDLMDDIQTNSWGNASSVHSFGQRARMIVDQARSSIATILNCLTDEIVFTSGGSESNNLAIKGIVSKSENPHVITSEIEHHSVLNTIKELEKQGKIEATYIKPDQNGTISFSDVQKNIKDNTVLVSIMYVNNETGVINPICEIGSMLEQKNICRKEQGLERVYLHTDAVQAQYLHIVPNDLKVDMMTISGHKLHGPKGIGFLYVRKGVNLSHEIVGGDQEFRLRAGTENVPSIAGLSKALDLSNEKKNIKDQNGLDLFHNIEEIRNYLENNLIEMIPNSQINGKDALRSPHISNMSFVNAEGEAIILNLDMENIAVSSGSACTSGSLDPSHVLTAMGIPAAQAHSSIRFSLSHETTKKNVEKVIEVLPKIIEKLRVMSPIK